MAVAPTIPDAVPAGDEPVVGGVGCALLDSDGGWAVVDDRLCELLGRSEEELLAAPVASVFNPDDLARERVRLEHLLAGGLLTYRSETRLLHADGHAIWALLDAAAIVYVTGVGRCLLQLQDISARRRLELSGTGWLLDADLDGEGALVAIKNLDGRYLRVNRAFEEFFTVSDERIRGRRDDYLFPQSIAAAIRAHDDDALARPADVSSARDTVPRPDGERSLEASRFVLAGASGRPWALCWVASELKEGRATAELVERLRGSEHAARAQAVAERAALLDAEGTARAAAGVARAALVERAGVSDIAEAPVPVGEEETREHAALEESARAARAEAEALRERAGAADGAIAEARAALDAEAQARAAAEAECARLEQAEQAARAELDSGREVHSELEAERAARAAADAERERLVGEVKRRDELLDAERVARGQAEAERDRLAEAERAAGERVPLPALDPAAAPGALQPNGDALAAWHAEGQNRLTWALAEATAVYEGAREALRIVAEALGFAAGGCYSADDPGGLRCCAFWQAPGVPGDDLETATWHASVRDGEGLVGRATKSGEPTWLENAATAKDFGRADKVAAAGLRTAVAVPITSHGETLGALEFFSAESRPADPALTEALVTVALQLGQFFMREEAESLRSRYGRIGRTATPSRR